MPFLRHIIYLPIQNRNFKKPLRLKIFRYSCCFIPIIFKLLLCCFNRFALIAIIFCHPGTALLIYIAYSISLKREFKITAFFGMAGGKLTFAKCRYYIRNFGLFKKLRSQLLVSANNPGYGRCFIILTSWQPYKRVAAVT